MKTAREVFDDLQMKAKLERYSEKIRMAGGIRRAAEVVIGKIQTV